MGGAVAVLLTTLSSCGGSDEPKDNGVKSKPAPEVAAAAADALQRAGAVHLVFRAGADGGDIRTQAPDDALGVVSIEGGKAELRSTGNQVFFNADEAFYKAQSGSSGGAVASVAAGKWVKLPGAFKDDESFGTFSFSGIIGQIRTPEDATYNPTVEPVDLEGRPAVKLTTSDGAQVFVSSEGEPFPLRVIDNDESGPTTVDFTEIGQRFTVEAPPAAIALPGT